MTEPAELTVRVVPGRGAVLPVQVRLPSTVVAAHGGTGEPIRVGPGEYDVVVAVPGGGSPARRVTVRAGERRTVELAAPGPAGPTSPDGVPRRTVHLLLLDGTPLAPPLRPVGAARVGFPGPVDPAPWRGLPPLWVAATWLAADRCELDLRLPDRLAPGRAFWLRVTAPPERARVVAVPATAGEACRVVVRPGPAVGFHLPDPTLDAFLQYRSTSDVASARAMLEAGAAGRTATSPVARALLSYTALRWGVPGYGSAEGRTADTDLPDTWVVEAERSARRAEHDHARELFALALRAGLPILGDGLGLLSTRLPQYLRLMAAGVVPESAALREGWAQLVPVLNTADLKAVSLTLRSDVPVAR